MRFLLYSLPFLRKIVIAFAKTRQDKAISPFLFFRVPTNIRVLILTIQVPEIPPTVVAQELPSRLLALTPKFLSYIISYLVLAIYWMAYHSVFRTIEGYDTGLDSVW